jgi:hypothetical protein
MGSKMKVIKSADGVLLNIGDWDFEIDKDGQPQNSMPLGAVETEEEVVVGYDGGLYLADDPRAAQ